MAVERSSSARSARTAGQLGCGQIPGAAVSVLDRPFASFSVGALRGQQTVDHPTKKYQTSGWTLRKRQVGPATWTTCLATREPGLRLRRVQTPRAAPRTACHESLRVLEARRAQARLRKVERVAERRHATKFLATHDPPAGAIRDRRARPVQGTTPRERSYQGGRSTRGRSNAAQYRRSRV
jgi:hypothetical protein